jgi:protein-export membrane protein, SecD/SecF family
MQNKGFVKLLAVLLTLVCVFYLSFTFVTNSYYKKAKEYAAGDSAKEVQYLDSLSSETVWLGYTLKKARTMEINLGLDLKGGMNVIMEISVADVLRSLSNNNTDPNFTQALANATERQARSNRDYISLFTEEYQKLDPGARLSAIFSTFELKDRITPQSSDAQVEAVLRAELKSAIDNSFNVLRTRIDRFGVVAPNIQQMETDGRISIELPGVKEPERVRTLLQGSANLEFWETFDASEFYQGLMAANAVIRDSIARANSINEDVSEVVTAEMVTEAIVDEGGNELLVDEATEELLDESAELDAYQREFPLFYVLNINPSQISSGPIIGTVKKGDRATVDKYFSMRSVKEALPRQFSPKWEVKPVDVKEEFYNLIAIKVTTRDGRAPLEGDVVTDASDDFGQNASSAEVSMTMSQEGAKKWARMTRENLGKCIAIVLDGNVYSYPRVNVEITGGRSQITGNFTPEDAKDLANVLKSGKMSAPARIVQEDVVGPSLGQEAIEKGFVSFVIALIILMVYLMVVYGWKPGMIANGALLLNLFFTLGVLASFKAVLTLSGIAGIVLALAMAVDANVLIYERIKEELRGGKTIKNAIQEGYKKAFSAIFDANLTSILTGFILFYFGTGPIRGFATTLIIGITVSFFTAVFLTRIVYEEGLAKGRFRNLTFTTSLTKNFLVNPTFQFLKYKKIFYLAIGICLLISLAALGLRGLNQGIDFTGGRNYVVRFGQDVNTVDIQDALTPFFEDHIPSVITIGASNQVRISTNYKIEDNSEGIDEEITRKIYDALTSLLPEGVPYEKFISDNILSSQKVGPSVADDMTKGAFWAVIFAVIGIALYILLRFRDWAYSAGTAIALTFDAIFILGAYALLWGFVPFSLEVDQTFIGAILTAIGYSVNDKVVIFDRVREYSHLYPKRSKYEVINEALNSTLDRTFNTSFSTLLVLIIIFIFAGEAIRSFAFAMILGTIIGTISSLFLASSVAYDIMSKKKVKVEN